MEITRRTVRWRGAAPLAAAAATALLAGPGCDDRPDPGSMQATPEEIQARGAGIQAAVKSGAYACSPPC